MNSLIPGMVALKKKSIDAQSVLEQEAMMEAVNPNVFMESQQDDFNVEAELKVVRQLLEGCMTALKHLEQKNMNAFTESVDELFLESNKSEAKKVLRFVELIMIHLFKLRYGNDSSSHNHLSKEIRNFRNEINHLTDWDCGPDDWDKSILNIVNRYFHKHYPRATKEFQEIINDDPKDYQISSIRNFPKESPWKLNELMDSTIQELVSKL